MIWTRKLRNLASWFYSWFFLKYRSFLCTFILRMLFQSPNPVDSSSYLFVLHSQCFNHINNLSTTMIWYVKFWASNHLDMFNYKYFISMYYCYETCFGSSNVRFLRQSPPIRLSKQWLSWKRLPPSFDYNLPSKWICIFWDYSRPCFQLWL